MNPKDIARLITEDPNVLESVTLYKGLSLFSGYQSYKHGIGERGVAIPGFLSSYHIARVYSQPTLTGDANEPSIIVEVKINAHEIEDKTAEFIEWADARGQRHDVSLGYPKEWRNGLIWTINLPSGAHGGVSCFGESDFVFCGIEKPYTVIRHYDNQAEWEAEG